MCPFSDFRTTQGLLSALGCQCECGRRVVVYSGPGSVQDSLVLQIADLRHGFRSVLCRTERVASVALQYFSKHTCFVHVSKAASQGREQAAARMVGDTCDTADNRRQTVRGITSCSCIPQYNCRLGYGKQFACNDRPYLHTALVFCDKSATRHTRCMSEVLLAPESQCRF